MSEPSFTPLSDDEIEELDNFLLSGDEEEARLTVDEAHGFVTALVVGRSTVEAEEWMETIWGIPAFVDDAEKQHMSELLLRMRSEIKQTLQAGKGFEPLIAEFEEDGDDVVAYEGWCYGFMLGVSLAQSQWEKLPQHEQELLAPIARLALVTEEDSPELDEEEYEMLTELLPGSVVGLYNYWRQQLN